MKQTAMTLYINDSLKGIVKEMSYYLEMEKQQIIDAMDVCQRTDFYVKYECSEDYYNKTFNK